MSLPTVDCKRFWVPRGSSADTSDDGFLVDPESEISKCLGSTALPFEKIAHFPVLALLGEPGIGKTSALENSFGLLPSGARHLTLDFSEFGSENLLRAKLEELLEKCSSVKGAGSHIVLDSLEQGLLQIEVVVPQLIAFLSDLVSENVTVCIACRTADWPMDLEAGLQKLWGLEKVGVYELVPLRRCDVERAAETNGISPQAFVGQVVDLGAGEIASRPISLTFLLLAFKSAEGLPSTRAELFQKGCSVLCDEWRDDVRRSSRASQFSLQHRILVAMRLAAAAIYCAKPSFWIGPEYRRTPGQDCSIQDLLDPNDSFGPTEIFTEGAIRQTLRTGLFRSSGGQRLGFVNKTLAEFLAASYLIDAQIPEERILELLFHKDGSLTVAPQLREVAGWLASMKPQICRALLLTDPACLLLSGNPPTTAADRAVLVGQILRLYDSGQLFDEQLAARAGMYCSHPNLLSDLRPYICDTTKNVTVRRVAMNLADLCGLSSLQPLLVTIALERTEPYAVRVMAASIVAKSGNEAEKSELKSLLTGSALDDPDDELKGYALAATWPDYLEFEELLNALSEPKKPGSAGAYQVFLSNEIASRIKPADWLGALNWAQTRAGAMEIANGLGPVAVSMIAAAIDHTSHPGISESLASVLLQHGKGFVRHAQIVAQLHANDLARRRIARFAISLAADFSDVGFLPSVGLFTASDLPYLLHELANGITTNRAKIAVLIGDVLPLLPENDVDLFDQAITASRKDPVLSYVLENQISAIEWPSLEADQLRAAYEEARTGKRGQRIGPDTVQSLTAILEANPSGNAFARVCYQLCEGFTVSTTLAHPLLPGWEDLEITLQDRIVVAAQNFLKSNIETDHSWIGTSELPFKVLYGFWALRLVALKIPKLLENFEAHWATWMTSVFGYPFAKSAPDEGQKALLRSAFTSAPELFLEALEMFLAGQNRRFGEIFFLEKLEPVWGNSIAEVLLAKLDDAILAPLSFRTILNALLKAGDGRAVQRAKALVSKAVNDLTSDNARAVFASLGLVTFSSGQEWSHVWLAVESNESFAYELFSSMAAYPFAQNSSLILTLREDQLAWLYKWIVRRSQKGRSRNRTETDSLVWLLRPIIHAIANRGSPTGPLEIENLQNALPDHDFRWHLGSARELLRANTWPPLTLADLSALRSQHSTRAGTLKAIAGGGDNTVEKTITLTTSEPKHRQRRAKDEDLDVVLREISSMKPKCHRDVFAALDGRTRVCEARPFKQAGGWVAGLERDSPRAHSWLSKRWSVLGLPPFRPGPK